MQAVWQRLREYLLPLAAISVIFVMLVPLPAAGLDFLLALSMTASVIVFLSAIQIRRAVELSVFPTLLLLLTLFRLSLNIASSRRILLHGSEGTAAAGKVIEAFGQFVVGGNYVVGFVLFLALVAIQFLVVSHGAVRTAEVTARFTLDALPGKQMAIDADMNAGLIDEAEARKRRQAIAREAEFYGAMDGAARFNQRDSLATILITAINIIAGLLIGTLQQGVELGEAARTYTVLTAAAGPARDPLPGRTGLFLHVPDSGSAQAGLSGRRRRPFLGREAADGPSSNCPGSGACRRRQKEGRAGAGRRPGGPAAA
jgi:flagellar biosynthesis protein FlhA